MHPPQFHAYAQHDNETGHPGPLGPFLPRASRGLRRGSGIRWWYNQLHMGLLCCRKIDLIDCRGHKSQFLFYQSTFLLLATARCVEVMRPSHSSIYDAHRARSGRDMKTPHRRRPGWQTHISSMKIELHHKTTSSRSWLSVQ
jgi:hypothetical protein